MLVSRRPNPSMLEVSRAGRHYYAAGARLPSGLRKPRFAGGQTASHQPCLCMPRLKTMHLVARRQCRPQVRCRRCPHNTRTGTPPHSFSTRICLRIGATTLHRNQLTMRPHGVDCRCCLLTRRIPRNRHMTSATQTTPCKACQVWTPCTRKATPRTR